MDRLNQVTKSDESLQYLYKGDPNIPIGILGFVDDTLAVAECGRSSIKKNSVINSFMEAHRITLSSDKSMVLHYANTKKCTVSCPTLKVHREDMKQVKSTKYLGNILSTSGGITDMIEDRRNQGWGKIATIMGILSEVDMGVHKVEVGLMLRQAILINSLLYTAEAWSSVSEKQLARLEVVDTSLLRQLTGGHSKCGTEFHHLETATWKLRHHLSYMRIMYHHHILTRDKEETIYKIYYKQKEETVKGDWFQLLKSDFDFIKKEMDENEIASTPKSLYKEKIKKLIDKSVFEYFINQKRSHKKLNDVTYSNFKIQPYLITHTLNNKQKELLYNLRSQCYGSKNNLKKMNRNNLQCIFKCQQVEDQIHTFLNCAPVLDNIEGSYTTDYKDICGSLS
jgi:hypothetical protein